MTIRESLHKQEGEVREKIACAGEAKGLCDRRACSTSPRQAEEQIGVVGDSPSQVCDTPRRVHDTRGTLQGECILSQLNHQGVDEEIHLPNEN